MSATNVILIKDKEQELNENELTDLLVDPLTILEGDEFDKNNGSCPKEFLND